MDLSDIVSISEMGGLYKVIVQREDGLVVTPLGENKNRFVSKRKHVFTPLDGITIYTDTDNEELKNVLQKMKEKEDELPPPHHKKASSDELTSYFWAIQPNYDQERVYVSDIKRIIKWYKQLDEHGMIDLEDQQDESNNEEEEQDKSTTSSSGDEDASTSEEDSPQ